MSFPKEVYETLSANSEMKRFLHIVKDSKENSYDYMVPIGKLTSYYNLTLLQKVKPTNYTPNCACLPKNSLLIYHKLKFIEFLIYKKRLKHRKKMIDFANSVLEFLMKWKKSNDGMIIHVNEEELNTYLVADPVSVVILLNKFNYYVSLITPILNSFSTKECIQLELIYVIEDISKSLIKKTSFFPIHRLQDKFEMLFLSPLLPFKEKIDQFIKDFPPHDSEFYLQELFSFVLSIFNVIKINQKPFDSTLVLLIIRLLFDKVYDRNVYLTTQGQDILHELSHITVKELTPPPDFSPPYSSDDVRIAHLFRSDKYFGKAVLELENIVFYTNPFDLLNCVDTSLSIIEKSATEYNNYQTMVFPFEVTFELFMAVVIASQIPNWVNVSKLVNTYTPNVGLCPSFEFSKAKMAASVMQFQSMVDEMHGNYVNEQNGKKSNNLIDVSSKSEKEEEAAKSLNNLIENKSDIESYKTEESVDNPINIVTNDGQMSTFYQQNVIENSTSPLNKSSDEITHEESLISNVNQTKTESTFNVSDQKEKIKNENNELKFRIDNQDENNLNAQIIMNNNSSENSVNMEVSNSSIQKTIINETENSNMHDDETITENNIKNTPTETLENQSTNIISNNEFSTQNTSSELTNENHTENIINEVEEENEVAASNVINEEVERNDIDGSIINNEENESTTDNLVNDSSNQNINLEEK